MNWLKENWWKAGLLLCGVVIAYAAYNYFVILPKQRAIVTEKNNLLEKQENCRKIGTEFFEKYENNEKSSILSKTIIPATFHYNNVDSTCYVETGTITYFSGNGSQEYRFITNLKTNRVEASLITSSSKDMGLELLKYNIEQQKEFSEIKYKLFQISASK